MKEDPWHILLDCALSDYKLKQYECAIEWLETAIQCVKGLQKRESKILGDAIYQCEFCKIEHAIIRNCGQTAPSHIERECPNCAHTTTKFVLTEVKA